MPSSIYILRSIQGRTQLKKRLWIEIADPIVRDQEETTMEVFVLRLV